MKKVILPILLIFKKSKHLLNFCFQISQEEETALSIYFGHFNSFRQKLQEVL